MRLGRQQSGRFVTIRHRGGRYVLRLTLREELGEERRERCAGLRNLNNFGFNQRVALRRPQNLDHRPCSLSLDVGDGCDRRYSTRAEIRRTRRNGTG